MRINSQIWLICKDFNAENRKVNRKVRRGNIFSAALCNTFANYASKIIRIQPLIRMIKEYVVQHVFLFAFNI